MSASRIFSNISSAWFLASGLWGDLLLIRIFLTLAYLFLILVHFELHKGFDGDDYAYENFFWGFVCLYAHASSAIRLFLDEGKVKLDEKQEQVSSGISTLYFCNINTNVHF